jgi:putative transposase
MTKKQRHHSPEQIIRKLAEGHKLMAAGMTVEDVCREFGIAESSWHRWLSQYGGMKADDAKRLKELEAQNARLKRIVADQALDIDMLKHLNTEKW